MSTPGFSYTDYDGQPDPAGDIRAVNADGTAKTVSPEAEKTDRRRHQRVPGWVWRKQFRDDGRRFVHDPSGGAYRGFKDKRVKRAAFLLLFSWTRRRKELRFSKP
ncbi:MAG: hypothetical protein ACLUAR_17660 [Pilosibacter sp.]